MERIDGYRDISDFKKLDRVIKDSLFAKYWVTDGINEYVFKEEDAIIAYRELFYSLVIRKLGQQSVSYDLAVLNGKRGVISKNYNSEGNESFSLTEILEEHWDKINETINKEHDYSLINTMTFEHCYNLEKMPKIIKDFSNGRDIKYDSIRNKLLNAFIIQVLFGNRDLTAKNIEVYVDKGLLKCAPSFDFGCYGEIDLNKNNYPYRFQNRAIPFNEFVFPSKTIESFFKTGRRKDMELFKKYLEMAKDINYELIFENIKEETENSIPDDIKLLLRKEVKDSLNDVSWKIKNI